MFCYKKIFFCFSLLIYFSWSCKTPPPEKDFSQLNWLLGTWEINNGSEYETWSKLNDSTFFGRNFRIYGSDTLVTEVINLRKKGNEIFYAPEVKTSKGMKVVNYNLTSSSDNLFVFESPQKKLPHKITYIQTNSSTAKTIIEDTKRKIEYNYKRLE